MHTHTHAHVHAHAYVRARTHTRTTHTSFTSMRVVPPQRTIEKWVLGPAFPDLHTPAVRKNQFISISSTPHTTISHKPHAITTLHLPLSQASPIVFHCHKPRPITTLYHALSLAPPHYNTMTSSLAIPSLSCSSSGTPPTLHHYLPL